MCVTSPPYFGLRDYRVAGQIGLEPSPEEYVREMVSVFSAVRRVLKDDGVLWLNLGDSYSGSGSGKGAWNASDERKANVKEVYRPNFRPGSGRADGEVDERGQRNRNGLGPVEGLKAKDLIGIPWRVALALQADGWYLRAACPWIKRNGMPDSTSDRPTQCVETMFMLTKGKKCYYDSEAVKVAAKEISVRRLAQPNYENQTGSGRANAGAKTNGNMKAVGGPTRLRRTSDWFFESWQGLLLDSEDEPSAFVVNLKGYKEAHFATFPPKLVEPCVLSSTSEKGECPVCGKAWGRITGRPCKKCSAIIPTQGKSCPSCGHVNDWKAERSLSEQFATTDWSTPGAATPRKLTANGKQAGCQSGVKMDAGWRPQCQCGHPPVPQTILDPFGGSGTTALVAGLHGRKAILCELNPDYVALAQKRLGLTPEAMEV